MKTLQCAMDHTCTQPVTHIEEKGFLYCAHHAAVRRAYSRRCRQLRAWEISLLREDKVLPSYAPVTRGRARELLASQGRAYSV